MNLAITGGAGFLGYHLCRGLARAYDEISVIDIVPIDPSEYPQNVKYFKVDVRDIAALEKVLQSATHVIHTAAALPLWKESDIYDINVNGTKNVMEIALRNKIAKVVYVSSTAVYGIPEKHPIEEGDPLVGVGPYGETKITSEKICSDYRAKGLCVPIVRPKTFLGTGRLGIFQVLYDWIESGKKIPILGNGQNKYQLLEVEDLVTAIDLLLREPGTKCNDTFNVGADAFSTVQDDVGALCEYAESGARIFPVPSALVKPFLVLFEKMKISPLYKWIYDTADKDSYVSIEKIKQTMNWKPRYSNAQALIRSYQWYLEHKSQLTQAGVTHRVAWKQGILGVLKRFF